MKTLIKRFRNLIKSPKSKLKLLLKDGNIIYIKNIEYTDFKIAHAVTPTETGICSVEGCSEDHTHGPLA